MTHQSLLTPADPIARVDRALEEIRAGKMVILVDDEDRENEGDLVLAGDKVTPEAINFMAKYARGLICLALEDTFIDKLKLPMMVRENQATLGTASYPVALDGLLYVEGLREPTQLQVRWQGGECSVPVRRPAGSDPIPDLGTLRCHP